MKQLLTLTSLIFILSANAQSIAYTIKDGDTLYSIAKDNNISINKIFKANEGLGFSPDEIYSGNKIYLPQKKIYKYDDICHSRIGLSQFSLYKSTKEIVNECLEKLYSLVDIDGIDPNNLSDDERLYLINKILDTYDYSVAKDEIDLLINAAEMGDIKAAYSAAVIDLDYFFNNINNQNAKNIINHDLPFLERKNSCNQYLKNEFYNDYDINIYFYLECADTLFDEGDNDFIKFDNELNEIIFSTNSQIIKIFELYAITSMSYRRLNSSDNSGALDLTSRYIALKCPDCEDSIDLFPKYLDSQDESTYSGYVENVLYYLLLNDTSARFDTYTPEAIIEVRNLIINFLKDRLENLEEDTYDFRSVYTAFNSDTALKLMYWGECELSKNYLDLAIAEYQSGYYDNSNEDYFIEPLYLSICFINKFLYNFNEYQNKDKVNAIMNSAKYYLDIAIKAKEELDVGNPIKLALLNTQEILFSILEKTINKSDGIMDFYYYGDVKIYLSDELTNELYNLSSILNQQDIYDFSGDIESFELLSSLYTSLHHHLYRFSWPDIDKIIDPVTLLNMKEKFFINSKLVNLKVENANLGLKEMQIKLVENNKSIKESSNAEIDYMEMLKLYKENADLIEQIFSLNRNLEKLTIGNTESIQSIQSSLNENEFAYFYVPSEISSKIILISKSEYRYWNGISSNLLKPVINDFISSINPNEEYDFDTSKYMGELLFPMFYSDNDFLKKNATIFIYTDNLIGLPPGILVKSYNDSPEISEYERLITAEWFINDYNFTTRLNYENNSDDSFEKKPFLGIGNSTSYNWVGLPNLNEVNSEITNLALTSFATKDDVLLGKEATKEFFLDKLEDSYERIVISTHSVPPNWQGLIEEPALVFNSKFGDYFLTPTEIINKNFNNDMVVLSSCNASIEGFDDLYKSFLIAGSKSVVHSNWNLESRYAREFTTKFFKELWLNDQKKHEVIRNVSLNFLNDYSNQVYAHPAYWGNFSIVYSSN